MRRTMTQKIICVVVAGLFLVNNLCYGLGVSPASVQPGKRTEMVNFGLDLKAAQTPEIQELLKIIKNCELKRFPEGAPAEIDGIKPAPASRSGVAQADFVKSFERPVTVGKLEQDTIYRVNSKTGKIVFNEKAVEIWEYIKARDLRYEITVGSEATATKETVSLADCILQ